MNSTGSRPKKRVRRRQYVVDWNLQGGVMIHVLSVLAGIGLLYVVGVLVLPSDASMAELGPRDVRHLLLLANAIYFILAGAILAVLALLLTHRIAGPALVLERALKNMRRGEYDCRVTLRERDYLKKLAAAAQALRDDLAEKDLARRESIVALDRLLASGDVAEARVVLERMKVANAMLPSPVAPRQPAAVE